MPWIARKFLKRKAKSKLVFYNIDSGKVKETRDYGCNSLRIVIITDLLTSIITFNFTDFYYKQNSSIRIHRQYHFPFYSKWGRQSDDYISLLRREKYHDFLDKDIFFSPATDLSSPLDSVIKTFNLPNPNLT
jgi:hypothetical protein